MNPVLVNAWRGNAIENYHNGAAAVVDVNGRVVWSIGEIQRPVFPRSAIKLLQSLALTDDAITKKFSVSRTELAFACSSHTGEKMHREAAQSWLKKIGCNEEELECGDAYPLHEIEQFQMISDGLPKQAICHTSSGSHIALLAGCKANNENTSNYRHYSHPTQRRWFDIVAEFTGLQANQLPWGYDDCGIPTLAVPLQRLAWAYARFADPSGFTIKRADEVETIQQAIAENPHMYGGTGELTTELAQIMKSDVIVKNGTSGVYVAVVPKFGYGIALKVDSGDDQAAKIVLGAVLEKLGALSADELIALGDHFRPDIYNSRGESVGRVEPSSAWDQGVLRF